jgi:hypothetical protein
MGKHSTPRKGNPKFTVVKGRERVRGVGSVVDLKPLDALEKQAGDSRVDESLDLFLKGWSIEKNAIDLEGLVWVRRFASHPFLSRHVGFGWFVEVGFDAKSWITTPNGIPIKPVMDSHGRLHGAGQRLFISEVFAWQSLKIPANR